MFLLIFFTFGKSFIFQFSHIFWIIKFLFWKRSYVRDCLMQNMRISKFYAKAKCSTCQTQKKYLWYWKLSLEKGKSLMSKKRLNLERIQAKISLLPKPNYKFWICLGKAINLIMKQIVILSLVVLLSLEKCSLVKDE